MGEANGRVETARAGSKRTAGRRRAVGTRDRIIAHLARREVADRTGMASTRLAEAVGYPGSSVAFAQLLSGMERDGLIAARCAASGPTGSLSRTARRPGTGLAASLAAGPGAGQERPSGRGRRGPVSGGRAELDGNGRRLPSRPAMAPAELDYDELAGRLLVQVARRLAATPADLQQTVAALELELASAWSRHGTLTAENVRLREEPRADSARP